MTGREPPALPNSATLNAWWRDLCRQAAAPRSIWLSRLSFWRIEALAQVVRREGSDPLVRSLLRAVALEPVQPLPCLARRVLLSPQPTVQMLRKLKALGLTSEDAEGNWRLTEGGSQALANGAFSITTNERRSFHFLTGSPEGTAPFIHVEARLEPWRADARWRFDLRNLSDCVARSAEWKRRHGFPLDIQAIYTLEPAATRTESLTPALWERVPVAHTEGLTAILAETAAGRLAAYAVRPTDWALQGASAAFQLEPGWRAELPNLVLEPRLENWREAFTRFARSAGLVAGQIENCRLERQAHRLIVRAPAATVERLRRVRPEAAKGEGWILAGTESCRAVACLEFVRL